MDGERGSPLDECGPDAGCMYTYPDACTEGNEVIADADEDLGDKWDAIRSARNAQRPVEASSDGESVNMKSSNSERSDRTSTTTREEEDEPLASFSDDGMEDIEDGDLIGEEHMEIDECHPSNKEKADFRQFWRTAAFDDRIGRQNLFNSSANYAAWYQGRPSYFLAQQEDFVKDHMFPLFLHWTPDPTHTPGDGNYAGLKENLGYPEGERRDVEHIAGLGCISLRGYNGHNITAEEMRGCYTSQCLVRKQPGFRPQQDGESFEADAQFFLSGLNDHRPTRSSSPPWVRPERHGCGRPHAANCMWPPNNAQDYAMPFHPSCLEVWKRASQFHRGYIDIGGLTG